MDKDIIRAYLWHEVLRLGFCPSGSNDQKHWLRLYGGSLNAFWEVDEYPCQQTFNNDQLRATISCQKQVSLTFEIQVTNLNNHNILFLFSPDNGENRLMWTHDVDSDYFVFPEQSMLNKHKKRKDALKKVLDGDMDAVIDGLICHPHAHQHLESPIEKHEIRIGGGINNPFLFLFHLRYQLCPIEEKRKLEKRRLIELFKISILEKKRAVQPTELMAQP